MQMKYENMFKILVLGRQQVGKTCLVRRVVENKFEEKTLSTIGVEFAFKRFTIGNHIVTLQFWDTAGQEKFKAITNSLFKGADGVIFVYDITDEKSFIDIEKILAEVSSHLAIETLGKILIGNKCDLKDKRMVSYDEGKKYADEEKMPFIETSAKDNTNVEVAFEAMAKQFLNKKISRMHDSVTIKPQPKEEGWFSFFTG